jgi:hypothetical protein
MRKVVYPIVLVIAALFCAHLIPVVIDAAMGRPCEPTPFTRECRSENGISVEFVVNDTVTPYSSGY